MEETPPFTTDALFTYRKREKLRFLIILAAVMFLILSFVASYFFVFRYQNILFFVVIKQIIAHVSSHIAATTALGMFYSSAIGGLFFITIPLEVVFVNFIRSGASPYLLTFIFLLGTLLSFTINYYMGMKLDTISKMIITPTKFYKLKGILNKRGPLAVFLFNAIPFFPAQPISVVLGVFKYNQVKFYVYLTLGTICKFAIIALAYTYGLSNLFS
jgi:membrane protein YqaA with SNARE-associated domain